jgi:uncharacterized phage-associated protein
MTYSASLIAYAFVKRGIEEGKFVTQMKLQKMVYFAHGYHLALYNDPLIKEEFQAWKFGPVVPAIYQDYKLYGSDKIIDIGLITSSYNILDLAKLDGNALDAINYTWEATKGLSATALSSWSHKKGGPWDRVYKPGEMDLTIDNTFIKEYFKGLLFKSNEPDNQGAA